MKQRCTRCKNDSLKLDVDHDAKSGNQPQLKCDICGNVQPIKESSSSSDSADIDISESLEKARETVGC